MTEAGVLETNHAQAEFLALADKQMEDLKKLLPIAREQGNKINISLIMITINPSHDDLQRVLACLEKEGVEVLYDDVEPDAGDQSLTPASDAVQPFDPSKINIYMDKMTMDSIIKRIMNNELEFDAAFQRKAGLWNETQKSQLIESLLLKIPLPAFYFDATDDDRWLIIDGLQRITTIREFVVQRSMRLQGMEFLKELNGKRYSDLPRSLQRRIDETNINAYLVKPSTPANVKFNIFKRINTGGLTLEPQEIRNALFQGEATKFLNELARLPEFAAATCGSIKSDRMEDREFCLRYVAFSYWPVKEYNGAIDEYLNNAMVDLNKSTPEERERIKNEFIGVLRAARAIFDKHAFRKIVDDRRRPINKVLFETWTSVLHTQTPQQIQTLIKRRKRVIEAFRRLCEDADYLNALKASDKKSMSECMDCLYRLVSDVLAGEE